MGLGQTFLKQKVRIRIAVIQYFFLISLTFVRNSHASHGAVGKTTRCFSSFFPNWFPRHIILKHSSAIYAKQRQVLTTTTNSVLWDKFFDEQSWYLLCTKFFDTRNFQKHQKAPWRIFSWRQKLFDIFFVIPTYIVYLNFCNLQMGSARNTRIFQKHHKGSRTNFSVLWDKKFPIFLVIPSSGLPKLSSRADQQRRLWRVLSLF